MTNTRDSILDGLRAAPGMDIPASDFAVCTGDAISSGILFDQFKTMIESVQGEVIPCTRESWPRVLLDLVRQNDWQSFAYGPNGPWGKTVGATLDGHVTLLPFDQPIEGIKRDLFSCDAGFTATVGAVAATGSLILCPGPEEPRTLSLVPEVHIALMTIADLHATLHDALTAGRWKERMPTNLVLVSGPSKTADIEQTLVFGVHGPKRLIVLAIQE
ncbi:lactate utilization protein [Magnetospira sp. QH-2]|uniref:LutC/YkgG family protein n=1 Tax=Magnetospira sp. (strain QH-2) TaxID=1288970 RepID=UPI0003E80BBE|nr:lactate utilization protein [Magnetospira sp. QH-2]CCQ74539.1 conserved protein of unknown function [Magnetospira sp. QH-2]